MLNHSSKRKSCTRQGAVTKKPRLEESSDEECSQSGISTDADENIGVDIDCATPPTPISSRSTPRFPSSFKTIPCTFPNCEKTFNRPANLTQHLRSHTNTRPFVCSHQPCNKSFLRESHLNHHIKSAHSNIREFVCPREGCGKGFVTGTRLRRHQAVHDGANKFRCNVVDCGQTFRKHGTLQNHISVVHEGKSAFVCHALNAEGEECRAGFDTAWKLRSHETRLHGNKQYCCMVCSPEGGSEETAEGAFFGSAERGTGFPTYAALQAHITIEHPPTCLECGRQCKSHRDLKSHVEIRHSALGVDERRTHACPEPACGRGFTKKGNLSMHIKTVHEGKVFICGDIELKSLNNIEAWDGSDACGRILRSKHTLEEHIRTAHLGLGHTQKHKRKQSSMDKPTTRSRKKTTSSLIPLTGAGYENGSGRDIACLILDCNHQFMRDYDLGLHLESHHRLSNAEIQALLADEDLFRRPTLNGSLVFATSQDLEAERVLDMQFGNDDGLKDIEERLYEALTQSPTIRIDDDRGEIRKDGVKILCTESNEGQIHAKGLKISNVRIQDMEMIDPVLR